MKTLSNKDKKKRDKEIKRLRKLKQRKADNRELIKK
jgi:hypothetical protein